MTSDDSDNPLAIEIRQETAASYFAACKKMVASLEALRTFDQAGGSPCQENEHGARRLELLEDAAERVYFVVIQREAMKLLCSGQFFEDYEIPTEVRALMGPRRG